MKKSASVNECGNCGQPETKTMNVCGRCRRVRYCDRACQAAHWKGGHKTACVEPKACNPKDQPQEDRSAEVICLICLGTKGDTYEHACRARLHPGCLADLYKHSAIEGNEQPPCPACRDPLPTLNSVYELFLDSNKYEECFEFIQGLPLNSCRTHLLEQGYMLYMLNRGDEAFTKITEFLKFDWLTLKERASGREMIGHIYRNRLQFSLAEVEYRAAVDLAPTEARHHRNLGIILSDQMSLIKKTKVASFKERKINVNIADLIALWTPLAKASNECLTRCLELNPNDEDALCTRCYNYRMIRNLPAALADVRAATRLSPESFKTQMLCGSVMTDLNMFTEARETICAGIKLNPTASDGYEVLWNLYENWTNYERQCGRPFKHLLQKAHKIEAILHKMELARPKC